MSKKKTITAMALAILVIVGIVLFVVFNNANNKENEVKPVTNEIVKNVEVPYRNVMYYGDWSIYESQGEFFPNMMPADKFTHLNFAFLDIKPDGSLVFPDNVSTFEHTLGRDDVNEKDINAGVLVALQDLRAKNPNLKVGVAVGGWSKSGDFSVMAADPVARANFVDNMMKFVKYTGMDFVDIDWEYPASPRQPDLVDNKQDEGTPNATMADKKNFTILLQELKDSLNELEKEVGKEYELSTALPAVRGKMSLGIQVKEVFEICDFVNIMSYDGRGAWDPLTGHHTGLYNNPNDPLVESSPTVQNIVEYLLGKGVPTEKIVIGVASYSRGWGNVDNVEKIEGLPGLYAAASPAGEDSDGTISKGAINENELVNGDGGRLTGIWSYRNFDKLKAEFPTIKEYWDDVAKAPYLFDAETGNFFTYENERSANEKAKYVVENQLGGVISWMASSDAPSDPNSPVRDKITKGVFDGLYTEPLKAQPIITSPLDITVEIEKKSTGDEGYNIILTNNEELVETDEVMKILEERHKTVMLPKLYIHNNGIDLMSFNDIQVINKDGISQVDLSFDETAKFLAPGESVTIALGYSQGGKVKTKNVESIDITQRIYSDGTEIERQNIYIK